MATPMAKVDRRLTRRVLHGLLFGDEKCTVRVFGGDQVTKIMDSFRLSDDIPIENKQVRQAAFS